jgi:hypothetical protein
MILVFIVVSINIFLALVIKQTIEDNYKIYPEFIELYDTSNTMFNIFSLDLDRISKQEKTFFIKKIIEEFLQYRFTIIADRLLMRKRIGLEEGNWMLSKMESFGLKENKYIPWYSNTKEEKSNFYKSTMKYVKKGITRSVEMLEEPYQDKDYWYTTIKLIYKHPSQDEYNERNAEIKKVKIRFEFNHLRNPYGILVNAAMDVSPVWVFYFTVYELELEDIK